LLALSWAVVRGAVSLISELEDAIGIRAADAVMLGSRRRCVTPNGIRIAPYYAFEFTIFVQSRIARSKMKVDISMPAE
jgi:hypothetical protein